MKEILDILMKAPIKQLIDIDPKLANLVAKKSGVYAKPKGTLRIVRGENDILYYHSDLAYGQRRLLGWTHERMVNEGEAEWVKPELNVYHVGGEKPIVMVGEYEYQQLIDAGWSHEDMVNQGQAQWLHTLHNPDEKKLVVVTCDHDTFQMIQKERWTNQQIIDAGYGHWENENER